MSAVRVEQRSLEWSRAEPRSLVAAARAMYEDIGPNLIAEKRRETRQQLASIEALRGEL